MSSNPRFHDLPVDWIWHRPLVIFLLALLSGSCQTGPGLKQEEKTAEAEAVTRIEALGGEVERDAALRDEPVIRVHLGGTAITDDDLEILRSLQQVRVINLYGTQITDQGLAHLSEMTSIDELQLSGTSISDEGLEHLQGLSRLVGLHVRGTGVTESGLEQLKQAIPGLIIRQRQPGT